VRRSVADVGVEHLGPDLELAGCDRLGNRRQLPGAPAPQHGLDPGHQLLGMAGLGDPVVGPAAQAADPVGDGRRPGAHEQRQAWERERDPLEIVQAGDLRVQDHRVDPHRRQLIRCGGIADHLALPAQTCKAPVKHGDEPAVVIDDRDPDRGRRVWRCHLRRSVEAAQDLPSD